VKIEIRKPIGMEEIEEMEDENEKRKGMGNQSDLIV
jgi:hypothetical protein